MVSVTLFFSFLSNFPIVSYSRRSILFVLVRYSLILSLDIFVIEHFCHWTFLSLDIFVIGHFCHWTFLSLDIFVIGHFPPSVDYRRVGNKEELHEAQAWPKTTQEPAGHSCSRQSQCRRSITFVFVQHSPRQQHICIKPGAKIIVSIQSKDKIRVRPSKDHKTKITTRLIKYDRKSLPFLPRHELGRGPCLPSLCGRMSNK